MTWLRTLASRFLALFRKRQLDEELEEELQFHLEKEAEENIRRGMAPEAARNAARRSFGGVEQAKEACRDTRGLPAVDSLWQDLRYGIRMLSKSPGFTAAAVVSLALGIGANTAIFSILDTIFFRPLPYRDPGRLVAVLEVETDKPDSTWGVSVPTFYDWKEQSQAFEELTIVHMFWPYTVIGGRQPERLWGRRASEGYLEMLGARACQGRLFVPEEFVEGVKPVVVLNHGTWERVFGSDPGIVGKRINLEGRPLPVVGVLCPDFSPLWESKIDLWTQIMWRGGARKGRYFLTIGRLREDVDIETAQAELDVIARRLEEEYEEMKGFGAKVMPLQEYLYGRLGKRFLIFLGAVGFVLLIACTNVANLMLVRAATREKEMALRVALGAARHRLVRQLLTESMLLAAVGAAVGLLLAYGGVKLLISASPEGIVPRADEIAVNWRILGFTLGIAVLTGLLFGLFPAARASKPNLDESLKETGGRPADRFRGRRLHNVLVVAEVALSLVLLIGAGLMIHNVWRILNVDLGFNPERLVSVTVELPRIQYVDRTGTPAKMRPEAGLALQRIRDRLEVVPGVTDVGLTDRGPLWGCSGRRMSVGNQPLPEATDGDEPPWACYQPVSTDYLRMLGVPVLKGRFFGESDHAGSAPVAIISESVAREYFPNEDPIGKLLTIGHSDVDDIERREVVGVVADVRQIVYREPYPAVYLPYSQLPSEFPRTHITEHTRASFVMRSAVDPAALKTTLRRAVAEVATDVPVLEVQTLDDVRSQSTRWSRFYAWLLPTFAGIAVILAAVGVFGVMSYSVTQRTREIGIRMALGAQPHDVLKMVMRRGLVMTLVGVLIGLSGAFALTRFLESQLYEVEPTDPATFAAVSALLAAIALVACLLPARRATRINPMNALRHE